jgi:PAS domain S-box-containing protein
MEERITKERLTNLLQEMRQQLHLLDSCKQEMQVIQTKYDRLLESAPDAMLFVNREGRVVTVNAQFEKLFGYKEEELAGKDLHVLIPERYRAAHRESVARYFSDPRARAMGSDLQIHALRKDGTEFPADISLSPLETNGELLAIASIRDITERKQSEALIERNYRVQTAISAVLKISLEPISLDEQLNKALGLILAIPGLSPDSRGCIYLVEDEQEVLALHALQGFSDVPPPCERVSFGECICGKAASTCTIAFTECVNETHKITHANEFPHGHYCVPVVSSGQLLGIINVFTEEGHERSTEEETFLVAVANTLAAVIMRHQAETERNAFREQLAEAEKLAALGRITANVAHEIRNPLTAIGGFARRLDKKVPGGSKEKQYSTFIVEEVTRLETILRDVLSFSRGTSRRAGKCGLSEIVKEAVMIFEETSRERSIRIEESFDQIPPIDCDRETILEAIENLVSNAIDAMPDGGVLSVATGEETVRGSFYLTVRVADTGEGIREEDLSRIFEPFYTTKPSPKGIGLGLPITKRFIEDHGGTIQVESRAGEGTTFILYFPHPGQQTD